MTRRKENILINELCFAEYTYTDLHKSNGPARIWHDGDWAWYLNGKDHRYYGPTCSFLTDWEIHGVKIK